MTTNELHRKGDNGIFGKVLQAKMLNAAFILCPYAVARLKFVRPNIAQTPMYYAKGVQRFQAPFHFLTLIGAFSTIGEHCPSRAQAIRKVWGSLRQPAKQYLYTLQVL